MPGPLRAPTFDELPEMRPGEALELRDGAPGIPPEAFAQALQDGGIVTNDNPLARAMQAPQPSQDPAAAIMAPAPQAPAPTPGLPDTSGMLGQGAPAPQPQPGRPVDPATMAQKIEEIRAKYGNDYAKLAQGYLHATQAVTRLGQENATLRGGNSATDERLARIEAILLQRGAPPQFQQPGYNPQPTYQPGPQPGYPQAPTVPQVQGGTSQERADAFFQDPITPITHAVEQAVQRHMQAFGNSLREGEEERRQNEAFSAFYNANRDLITNLQPVIDTIYAERPHVYNRLVPVERLDMLLRQAVDRVEGYRGRQMYEQIDGLYSANGGAATAPPAQGGNLPYGMTGRAAAPAPLNNPSTTPAMRRLWGAPSGSLDEEQAVVEVLRERGFHAGAR